MIKSIGYAAKNQFSSLHSFEFERRDPNPDDVVIDVLFCGVCHSDVHQVKNEWANTVYPCLPGHEIVGRVFSVGEKVTRYRHGDMVGVGCMVDSCGVCESCQEGLENYCSGKHGWTATYNGPMKPDGTNTYGGYSNYIVVKEHFVLSIPDALEPAAAAPILCAGVTTYSPLKHWKVSPGQKVGVVGLGGLGHMAVKLAVAMGAYVTVFTTHKEKEDDAFALGASGVIIESDKAAMASQERSFDFILDTIPQKHDVNPFILCLKRDATLCLVGPLEPLAPINNQQVAMGRRCVAGSVIGGISETQEVLNFCAEHSIAPNIEIIGIGGVNDAFKRIEKEDVRFRFVIDMQTLKAEAATN
ncbi:MAG: NAD(P)-dependent alcohol dehydrogenase [Armatimonadetes bacterium]|nr:NAD(P)-dependent alcohol dehydrogenase [Armatimonadota bacterium]